ncbi:MAG TPA: endonuclease [Anaerolineae bacterium]
MNVRLLKQMEEAERRYAMHAARREERQRNLDTLGDGGDWRKVDEPERILSRLNSLGMQDLAGEAMASFAIVADGPLETRGPAVPSVNVLERIIDINNLLNSQFLIKGAAVARTVARIVIRNAQGRVVGYGTGFMVSPRLIMTNNHVLDSARTAQQSIAQFYYYETLTGDPVQPASFALQPQVFFQTDEHLDFTLVALQEMNPDGVAARDVGWNHLIPESGKAIVGEPVNILQHPGGSRQQVALRQNSISDLLDDFMHYSADTDRGSSGGPVCNDQWELAALHHAGVPRRDSSRRVLLKSGVPWDGSDQTVDQIDWIANEGTRISRIVAHVRGRMNAFSAAQRRLFEQAFEPAPYEPAPILSPRDTVERTSDTPASGPRFDEQGRAVWTIPIEIRIGLGSTPVAIVPGIAAAADSPVDVPAPSSDLDRETPEETPELLAALARLRECEVMPYYDAKQDQAGRDVYYQDIDVSQSADTLFIHLHKLVRDTHHTVLSYKDARLNHLYPWVDLHEDELGQRSLRSIYSGKGFDAEEIIREEFAIEARREAQLQEMLATESDLSEERLKELLDLLEAQSPFNCEHVVPQSWFQEMQPMKTDLHHLFTCEWGCNSFRSNIPFYDFPPEEEVFRDDCGRRDGASTKFEPSAGKGAVARATLYFLLRYPGMIGDEVREMQRERLPVLLQWHQEEPVTNYERHRNAAIFAVQGNRNPFIDFPEWAGQVSFNAGFGVS